MDINSIWEKSILILKEEVAKPAFKSFIEPLIPVRIEGDTFVLYAKENIRGFIDGRYKNSIEHAISEVTSGKYKIKTITDKSEIEKPSVRPSKSESKENSRSISNLNPKYTFDTFVIGNSNSFAHAACVAVAEAPAKSYNPLFLYGGVGLGKTHLMQAIGHHILDNDSTQRVVYVSSEKFTNELVNSIKDDKNEEFRNKYRNIDVLLIDDVQFIAGKERTQEEFFHTFNTLHEANKQIIISSDRPPKDIPTLEERLRSRFEMGLITDIQPPDFETRIAILRKKAQMDNVSVPDEVTEYIAKNVKSNIRELEGALTRVMAFSSLTKKEISLEVATEALKDILSSYTSEEINVVRIKEKVSEVFNIKMEDFNSKKRTRAIAYPRQIAMYLSRELTDLSLPKIGEEFGGRDHTTVIHACDKISKDIQENIDIRMKIEKITNDLKG